MRPTLLIIALVLAALRVAGHTSEAYQAAAHLFVGGLLGAWLVNVACKRSRVCRAGRGNEFAAFYLGLAIALSIVEVACFLVFRFAV
jgi:hypothetical protein